MLFVHKQFKSQPCNKLNNLCFEDSVLRLVCLNKEEQLLVGVIFRCPNCTASNDEKLLQLYEKVKTVNSVSRILVMGDFDFPDIKWQEGFVAADSNSISGRFFTCQMICFLYSMLIVIQGFETTRSPHNDDNLIVNIDVLPPLGKSDHVALHWIFHCSSEIDLSSGSIDRLSYDKLTIKK